MANLPRSRVENLVDLQAARRQSIVERLIRAILGLWISFERWDDDDLVRVNAAQSLIYVEAALREARRTANAYQRAVLREIDATPEILEKVEYIYPRSEVDMLEVYERPAKQYRWEIRKGKSPQEAIESLERRVTSLADLDVAAVTRDETAKVMRSSGKVIGYRRIIHPELSRTGVCGLCVVAATQFYSIEDLDAIHNLCKCEVLPVTTASDPGLRLNRGDLDRIYAGAAATSGDDYAYSSGTAGELLKRVRVEINEHGELGPVLVKQGDHFRDVAEVGRGVYVPPTAEENRAKAERRLDELVTTLDSIIARRIAGETGQDLFVAEKRARESVRALELSLASAA